ncbi:MAG: SoxR reducing system RseC family protein [Methylotenera sp.]|nr:SoxR reducing system RseC family protein [Methylotenera sp.]
MIEEYAIVTARAGTQATLEIERHTACSLCGQKRGCGNATWGKLLGHSRHAFTAENPVNANVGDSVVVGIDEHAVLNSAFYLYVVPLIGLLVGTVLANYFFSNQFYVILGAALGLVLGFLWVKGHLIGRNQSGIAYSKKYQAVILRRAED